MTSEPILGNYQQTPQQGDSYTLARLQSLQWRLNVMKRTRTIFKWNFQNRCNKYDTHTKQIQTHNYECHMWFNQPEVQSSMAHKRHSWESNWRLYDSVRLVNFCITITCCSEGDPEVNISCIEATFVWNPLQWTNLSNFCLKPTAVGTILVFPVISLEPSWFSCKHYILIKPRLVNPLQLIIDDDNEKSLHWNALCATNAVSAL